MRPHLPRLAQVIDTRTDSERRMGTASQAGELRDSGMLRSLSHSFVMVGTGVWVKG